jgi:hypothetical protein
MMCSGRILYWKPERLEGGKQNKHQANMSPLPHTANSQGATSTRRASSTGSSIMQRHATLRLAVLCIFTSLDRVVSIESKHSG